MQDEADGNRGTRGACSHCRLSVWRLKRILCSFVFYFLLEVLLHFDLLFEFPCGSKMK